MRSHPQLPLAMPKTDPEAVLRKGKASEEGVSTTEPGNPPYPSMGTPFSPPQFFDRPVSGVSHFLNFGSVPVEFSSPDLGPKGQDLVTPLSPKAIPQCRLGNTEDFPTHILTTPAQREAPVDLSSLAFSLNPLLFATPLQDSFPIAPSRIPSPPSSPQPNILMAGANHGCTFFSI